MTWFNEIPMLLNDDEHWNVEEFNFSIKRLEQTDPQKNPILSMILSCNGLSYPFLLDSAALPLFFCSLLFIYFRAREKCGINKRQGIC